jgi:hypothetical protein
MVWRRGFCRPRRWIDQPPDVVPAVETGFAGIDVDADL